jgi:hypothetical protein
MTIVQSMPSVHIWAVSPDTLIVIPASLTLLAGFLFFEGVSPDILRRRWSYHRGWR